MTMRAGMVRRSSANASIASTGALRGRSLPTQKTVGKHEPDVASAEPPGRDFRLRVADQGHRGVPDSLSAPIELKQGPSQRCPDSFRWPVGTEVAPVVARGSLAATDWSIYERNWQLPEHAPEVQPAIHYVVGHIILLLRLLDVLEGRSLPA
jgi:hypothetical protein